ncbi:MAG: SIS domain-containing protein [Kiritimatiellae bacterium]|nr:SIS domain-containing protein [Kiritimatiellia bacterium]
MDWDDVTREGRAVLEEVTETLRPRIEEAVRMCVESLTTGGRILACGNGGSAADAQHFAAELVNRFLRNRPAYAAIALTTDTSTLTSIANDSDYSEIFSRQIEALGSEGDVLIVFSTSGRSPNVIRAARVARERGLRVIAVTGRGGGELSEASDCVLDISASESTPRIQEGHLLILHALCERIEEDMEPMG